MTRSLTHHERRTLRLLCAIYSLRLLGLYIVLPVLSPHAHRLPGATSLLTGLSLGVYGVAQALFQIPFGALSDRIGRKRAISIGLLLFAAGSFLAGMARDAWLLTFARALQGSGAIASTMVSMVADVTREEVRTQAMASLGIWIGATLAVSFVVGPIVAGLLGVPILFHFTGVAALVSLFMLNRFVRTHAHPSPAERLHLADLVNALRHRSLLLVDVGAFLLHMIVTILFVLLPFRLEALIDPRRTWVLLLPAIFLGLVVMTAVARFVDRGRRAERVLYFGATALAAGCVSLGLSSGGTMGLISGLVLIVIAVATLEPVLISILSRLAPDSHRGTASGVFSMAQFSGTFAGGLLGGAFLQQGHGILLPGLAALSAVWLYCLVRGGRIDGGAERAI